MSRARRWVSLGVELAKKLSESLPDKDDSAVRAAAKLVTTADAVRSVLWPTVGDPVAVYVSQHGLRERRSEPFVRMFFATDLADKFTIGHVRMGDYRSLVDARGPMGHFAFVKSDYETHHEPTFYVGESVDMTSVLEALWASYNGRIHVTVAPGMYGRATSEFASFDEAAWPLFGEAPALLKSHVERFRRCKSNGVNRSYMLFGPPGTGKSLFAMKLAQECGRRTMKLSASSLQHASVKDILYLFENLSPDFLLIDDVDKVDVGNALSTLLEVLQRLKRSSTAVVMTANAIDGFDVGLLRPERIDTWIEFGLPDVAERRAVLASYASAMQSTVPPRDLDELAQVSCGLSHDYLRELVTELRQNGSMPDTRAMISTMKRLLGSVKSSKSEAKPTKLKESA